MNRVDDACGGKVPWYERAGSSLCEQCTDQHQADRMLWCLRYGNDHDPSLVSNGPTGPAHKGKGKSYRRT